MPQRRHDAWGGYERLIPLDKEKKPIKNAKAKAQCKKCGRIMHNIKRESLAKHTKLCKGPQVEDDESNDSTTMPSGTSSLSNHDLSDVQSRSLDHDSNSLQARPRTPERFHDPSSAPSTSKRNASMVTNCNPPNSKRTKNRRTSDGSGKSSSSLEMDDEDDCSISRSSSSTATAGNITQQIKKVTKNRRRTCSYEPDDEDKHVALYKYYVVSNIDFENVKLPATKELLTTLDPKFTLPTVRDLCTTIAEKASEKVHVSNHSKRQTQVVQILTRVVSGKVDNGKGEMLDWNKIQTVSLLRAANGSWTYVKNHVFLADPNDDISEQMQEFCDESVLEVKLTFDVDVLFVLHSGLYKLKDVCSVTYNDNEEIHYYTLPEMSSLLNKLHCDLVSNRDNHNQVAAYYKSLEKISSTISDKNPSMAVSMQRLCEAIDVLDEINQSIVSEALSQIVNPLHLSTKVFQPEYHISIIDKPVHSSLLNLFQHFHQHTAPRLLADCVPYYIEKSGSCFTRFYHEKRELNPENFWNASKLDPYLTNIKLLANYALQLLSIPSALTRLDLKEAFKKLDKETVKNVDFERVVFTYLLQE